MDQKSIDFQIKVFNEIIMKAKYNLYNTTHAFFKIGSGFFIFAVIGWRQNCT